MASFGEIENLLKNLRTPTGNKILFESYLKDAWNIFQFDGDPNLPAFEAFLIAAVSRCFEKADRDSDRAKSRDACLVGLGLLKGCYHTKTEDGISTHVPVDDRYVQYLQGDYIDLMRPTYKEGDNLNPDDRKSKPRRALDKSEARARERLASHLADQFVYGNGYQASLQAGIENHTKSNESSEGKNQLEIVLPEPSYTLEKFSPADQLKANLEPQPQPDPTSEPDPIPEPDPILEPNPDYIHIRKQRNVAIFVAIGILFIVLCCGAIWFMRSKYETSCKENNLLPVAVVEAISIVNDSITVSPGHPVRLKTYVYHPRAGLDGLECEPENKNLVRVEKMTEDFRVIVNDGWQEETDYTTTIKVYAKDDPAVYAEATVTVEPPAYIPDPSPSGMNHPVLAGTSEKGSDSNWNDYTE